MTSIRPLAGVFLCGIAALVFAAPTLFLAADSPTGPKVAFLVVGTIILALGALRIRREGAASSRGTDEPTKRVSGE